MARPMFYSPPSYFSPHQPRGTGVPWVGGVKNKYAVQVEPTQRKKQGLLNATQAQKINTAKPPFTKRPECRIIFHAVRPFGRCVGGASTCAGSQVLAHLRAAAFLFFDRTDYSREGLQAQGLFPNSCASFYGRNHWTAPCSLVAVPQENVKMYSSIPGSRDKKVSTVDWAFSPASVRIPSLMARCSISAFWSRVKPV